MTTTHLGIEEMMARQQSATMERTSRHTWHLTDFWRHAAQRRQRAAERRSPAWRGELVEWGVTYARLAML